MVNTIWNVNSDEGVTIGLPLRGQVLRVHSICVVPGETSFGLEYEVGPANDISFEDRTQRKTPRVHALTRRWWITGHDDVGTEYEALSGVFAPSPKNRTTHGILDVSPVPPSNASWLDITFHGDGVSDERGDSQYVLRVALPLRTLTYKEIAKKQGMTESHLVALMKATTQVQQEEDVRVAAELRDKPDLTGDARVGGQYRWREVTGDDSRQRS